jgi:Ca2+-binding RTX toxin-like protein
VRQGITRGRLRAAREHPESARGRRRGLGLGAFFATLLFVAVAAPAANAGPVLTMGIDAEDGGPGGHGDPQVYATTFSNGVLAQTTNGGDGILVIGGGKSPTDDVTEWWDEIGTLTGETITYANGANIGTQSFGGFQVIGVATSQFEAGSGGLTDAENDALGARNLEVANFVNGGGGLIGFSQTGLANQYAYLPDSGQYTFTTGLSFDDIEATPEGEAVGLDDTSLDVCCWHDEYNTFPSYLSVLAINVASGAAVALGGGAVTVPENCTNGVDDNGDGLVDGADPLCRADYYYYNCPGITIDGKSEQGGSGNDTIVGTPNNDLLLGGDGNDSIDGIPGDDCINGQGGDDDLVGADGNDNIAGEAGRDDANGNGGNDEIDGGTEPDTLDGDGGNDRVVGRGNKDKVKGNDGRDRVRGSGGKDKVKGNAGRDRARGGTDPDKVDGGSGNDLVQTQGGEDKAVGGTGEDFIRAGGANDKVKAADGDRDKVKCGDGKKDKATVDPIDRVFRDCERVKVR